jgi:poly(hydroxyalkanoate) depolymerase family esterase
MSDGIDAVIDCDIENDGPAAKSDSQYPGEFLNGSISNEAGTREYKLYIPSCYHGQPLPLVVMLHGCTQDPDDFAVGTRMNMIAEERHCFVLYPAQTKSASMPKCWSWFSAANQQRERGEPSLIADVTREVIRDYQIDESKVFIAGLSAGGAMAAIMVKTYPDIFKAVAIHSGMPYSAAKDLFSALSAMKYGPRTRHESNRYGLGIDGDVPSVPTIVFHGDADTVVNPCNGDQVLKQAVSTLSAGTADEAEPNTVTSVIQLPEGRSYTRTVHHDSNGQTVAEQWLIHGTGHAWSGGSIDGTYTDPHGPDATSEMMRFFYEQAQQ